MAYIKRLLYPIAYLLASIVLVMFFGVSLVFASPIYTPGETLNPGCLPINPDCTVTPQVLLTGNNSWTGTQQFSNILSPYFTATSTATASVFPYASTTAISATTVCISTDCKTAWPAGGTSFFETGVDTNNIKNTNTGNVGVGVFTANDPTNLLHINSVSSPITSQFRVSTGMNNVGAVTGAVVNSVGSGYSVNDIVTVVGGDNNATLKIDSVTNGQVNNFSINAGGTGYTVGDILTISGGNANSTVSVATLKAPYGGLGSEIFLNGSFVGNMDNWTSEDAGWSYGANNVVHTAGFNGSLVQTGLPVLNGFYALTLTIGGTAGTVNIDIGDQTTDTQNAGAGTITLYSSGGSGQYFRIIPSSDFDGTITDVSLKPVLTGAINYITLVDGGTGYVDGTGVALTGGTGADATIDYFANNMLGQVSGLSVVNAGTGYVDFTGLSTTGAGDNGLEVDVTTISAIPNTFEILNNGQGGQEILFNASYVNGSYVAKSTTVSSIINSNGALQFYSQTEQTPDTGANFGSSELTISDNIVSIAGSLGVGMTGTPLGTLQVSSPGPARIMLSQTDAPDDEKNWQFDAEGSTLYWGLVNDGGNMGANYARITRTGFTPTEFDLMYGVVDGGSAITVLPRNVGIRNYSPTALLHLGAGTADAGTAPLKFSSGALLTASEDGAIEYLSNQFYIRGTDGLSVAGNVGIGTGGPLSKLSIGGVGNNSWQTSIVSLGSTAATYAAVWRQSDALTDLFYIRDDGAGWLKGTLTQNSDERLKTNIQTLTNDAGLSIIDKLNPVTFNWINTDSGTTTQFGFIAQQVQQVLPDLVTIGNPTSETPGGTLGVNYIGLLPTIVKAIQEQQLQIRNISSSSDQTSSSTPFMQKIFTSFLDFLTGTVVKIKSVFVTELHIEDKLCVDDVCINKDQLKTIFMQAGGVSTQIITPPPVSTPPVTETSSTTPPVVETASTTPPVVEVTPQVPPPVTPAVEPEVVPEPDQPAPPVTESVPAPVVESNPVVETPSQ